MFSPAYCSRPGVARRLVHFLARPRKSKISVQANLLAGYAGTKILEKEGRPWIRAHLSVGNPVLPASRGRLRNSTWRGTQYVPRCGTDSVHGGAELGAESESWAPVLTLVGRVLAPAPANGAALNVSTGAQCSSTSPHRVELLGAPQGEFKSKTPQGLRPLLSPELWAQARYPAKSGRSPESCFYPSRVTASSVTASSHPAPDSTRAHSPQALPGNLVAGLRCSAQPVP